MPPDPLQNPKAEVENPRILDWLVEDLHRRGVVGEDDALKLLYLCLTSRFLARPVSAVVKGPTSAGKSYLLERVLEYFPSSAYYALSSMSERALIYDREPLAHRILVIHEARGVTGRLTNYLLRSILSEGRVRYATTMRRKGEIRTCLVERDGPTGLITTTTDVSLHPEHETRLLSINVTDDRWQTRCILESIGATTEVPPISPEWLKFQTWLETAEHRVCVPFAERLMELIPPVGVRLRRDAHALMSLIQTHAILYQGSRGRDPQGRILATLDDYAAVRPLVADIFTEGATADVPKHVRRVVGIVQLFHNAGAAATVGSIARFLDVDKSTASRHVKQAIGLGFLANCGKFSRIHHIDLGERLPQPRTLLPEVAALQHAATDCATHNAPKPVTKTPPEEPKNAPNPRQIPNKYPSCCTVAAKKRNTKTDPKTPNASRLTPRHPTQHENPADDRVGTE